MSSKRTKKITENYDFFVLCEFIKHFWFYAFSIMKWWNRKMKWITNSLNNAMKRMTVKIERESMRNSYKGNMQQYEIHSRYSVMLYDTYTVG